MTGVGLLIRAAQDWKSVFLFDCYYYRNEKTKDKMSVKFKNMTVRL